MALASAPADSNPFAPRSFKSRVDPQKIQLGQPFTFEVELTHSKDQRFELRTPKELGPFELVDQKRSREDGAAEAVTTFRIELALFELGKKQLPDLTFEVVSGQNAGTWVLPGLEVEGVASLPSTAEKEGVDLKDLAPLVPVPVRTYRVLYALAALLALGALVWAWLRYRKRPRPLVAAPIRPPAPLPLRTRAALEALRAEDLPGQGKVREFYFRLSEIIRGHLGERYGFDALESTSHELLSSLRRMHTPGLSIPELERFSNESDLVKFAKTAVDADGCKAAMEYGFRLVEQTLPSPPLTPAATSRNAGHPLS